MNVRLTHLLPVLLILLLAATTLWLRFTIEAPQKVDAPRNLRDPDAIADKVTIARLDASGVALYHLSALRMVHYPESDVMELTAPRFLKKDAGAEVTVTAEKGVINQEIKQAKFTDNVELVRRAEKGPDVLRIRTEYMEVLMDRDIARTDRPVTITQGPSTLSGTGLEYERKTGRLTLLSRVKGVFHVQKK